MRLRDFVLAFLSLIPAPAWAGLLSSPDGAYQVWYPKTWYAAGADELVPEADPGCCSLVVLEPFVIGKDGLLSSLREVVKDKRGGAVMESTAFQGLVDRQGAVVYAVRLRGTGLYHMAWAAVPLGDGRASLVTLRTVNSSITGLYRSEFLDMAGTAALVGELEDLPLDELGVTLRKIWEARGVAGASSGSGPVSPTVTPPGP